jgi:hypothetical protein
MDAFAEIAKENEPRRLRSGLWARRAWLAIFLAFAVLALLDVFGQADSHSAASAPQAVMRIAAPRTVRGGLYFQSRVQIRALQAIDHPRLLLARGWIEGMQVNSIEPAAMGETTRDGRLVLSYDSLAAGDTLDIWMQFQVDPTNVGHRSYALELDDAETPITRIDRKITVLP